ncbi:MAG: four helix bundle protein [Candidatus Omnitrophota bacterium]
MGKGYKKLLVWQKADELAYEIYIASKEFPKEERYGLTSQLRRAALSVPTNLVEGMGRQGRRELKQFVNIALGSLAETEYLMEFCGRLGYLSKSKYDELEKIRNSVGGMLWKFYKSL